MKIQLGRVTYNKRAYWQDREHDQRPFEIVRILSTYYRNMSLITGPSLFRFGFNGVRWRAVVSRRSHEG